MYFIKANDGKNKWWQYAVTLLVTIFAYLVIGALPLGGIIAYKTMIGSGVDLALFNETYNPEALGISQNFGLVLLLFPSIIGFFSLWAMIVWVHRRKSGQIASAEGRIRWNRLLTAAAVWLALLVVAELISVLLDPENYQLQFSARKFIPLFIIAVLFIPFQTWFEELLFRAYLLQGIGLLFRSRIIALIITAIGFGLLHAMNPEVQKFGLGATMPYYIGFGLFAGLLVVFDNGIELTCGVHAISNVYSAVFVTYQSSVLQTPAVWRIKELHPWLMNVGFLIMAIVFILLMHRKYQWGSWKKLYQPIVF